VKHADEIKIGFLALVGLTILYFGFRFLKGTDLFTTTNTYYVVYKDVDGLTASNPVIINGYPVGRVNSITYAPELGNRMVVELDVDEEVALSSDTQAKLEDAGALGGKQIRILPGKSSTPLQSSDTLPGFTEAGLMAMLSEKAGPLTGSVETTLKQLNKLLTEFEGIGKETKGLMASAKGTSDQLNATLAENRSQLKALLIKLNSMAEGLNKTQEKINPILENSEKLTKKLADADTPALIASLKETSGELNKTLKAINQSKGTAGKLIHDDKLYNNLNKTLADLDSILVDFQARPKRYIPNVSVFGRKDKKKK
jgi:phospholipid/cholesterol/gamma-HCH transport system substrate-binding protein